MKVSYGARLEVTIFVKKGKLKDFQGCADLKDVMEHLSMVEESLQELGACDLTWEIKLVNDADKAMNAWVKGE